MIDMAYPLPGHALAAAHRDAQTQSPRPVVFCLKRFDIADRRRKRAPLDRPSVGSRAARIPHARV
jgi:hypothetical protein